MVEFSKDGYSCCIYVAGYMDWAVDFYKGDKELFSNPHYFSLESYPDVDYFDEGVLDELIEMYGEDDEPEEPAFQNVLCQCGWGLLNCPAAELPTECPMCGCSFCPNTDD